MRREVYGRVAGIPTVTTFRPAIPKLTANAEKQDHSMRMIPISLPRLRFVHGDVEEVLEPSRYIPPKEEAKVLQGSGGPLQEACQLQPRLSDTVRKYIDRPVTPAEQKAYDLAKGGLDTRDVAKRLGVSKSAARKYIQFARLKLQRSRERLQNASERERQGIK